jgi:hypothetical protein
LQILTVALVREIFASYADKFEAVSVENVAADDISQHLQGVHAVIHVAAPLPSKGDPKALLDVSVLIYVVLSAVLMKLCSGCPGGNFKRHPPS